MKIPDLCESVMCVVCLCVCLWQVEFLHLKGKLDCKFLGHRVGSWTSHEWFLLTENVTYRQERFLTSVLLDRWQESWILSGNDTTHGITWPNLQERAAVSSGLCWEVCGNFLAEKPFSLFWQPKFSQSLLMKTFCVSDRRQSDNAGAGSSTDGYSIIPATFIRLDRCLLSSAAVCWLMSQ